MQFDRIVVKYGNHKTRAYPFRMLVAPNGSSPVLDLVGGDRDITNVESGTRRPPGERSRKCGCTGRR